MALQLTREGRLIEMEDGVSAAEVSETVLTTADEWQVVAGGWPLKRLVEIWNQIPGVEPVRKFTSRAIALRRIWRALIQPESAGTTARRKATGKKQRADFREGSKAAEVYRLLCRPEGATLGEIQQATGWQRHSVRGFVSAQLRKQGSCVRSFQRQGERVYRLKS